MIKVVVVEDQHPILRSIIKQIANFSSEVSVIGEATDGLSALERIQKLRPDIVFTDIRMPGIDGLELIENIKKTLPGTIFVIISGHDEFQYARQAMKLGVTEFMLKPIHQKTINEVLSKLAETIHYDRHERKKRILYDTLHVKTISESLTQTTLDYDDDSNAYSYVVMLICAGSYSNFPVDVSHPLCDFWSHIDLPAMISTHWSGYQDIWILDGQAINEQILIWGFKEKKQDNVDPKSLAESVMCILSSFLVPITISVSTKTGSRLADLKIEYQFSRAMLRKNLIFGASSIILSDKSKLAFSRENFTIESIIEPKKLSILLSKKNKALFLKEIEHMLEHMHKEAYKQSAIEKCLKVVAALCENMEINQHDRESDIELEIEELLSFSLNYKALFLALSFTFSRFFSNKSKKDVPGSIEIILDRVDKYLLDHYSENISIHDIAEMVNLNSSHLSREFKKYKGMSPMDFLTHTRIQKAKELILTKSDFKLMEIAGMVGYSNQFYFSKIFKIVTGLSPSEYRVTFTPSNSLPRD
ncbi:response regulator [Paenibacillus eucommiae]|uniref:Two-component system response regulator YesN n=1 Tax=Paenibacillus eucommiae TaxID=1355755 RepID=A0ABS4ISQ3_9BACL|nr:response regulator [Paenibacillus eucommiae]MBP1990160.1 two-component system response regulator YesN [Paenibacillus eucommiae]